ncbi:MAG: hypothetical protein NXI13_02735 [Proteobacteria bacterium]|nr:hypothetical protein [Pseudomonadota bacterium]
MSLKRTMSPLVWSVTLLFLGIFFTAPVVADDGRFSFGRSIEGTYILDQHGETGRSSYTFTEFGSVIWGASDQKHYSYFPGAGVWKQTGERAIAVRILSFDYDSNGVGIVNMTFNFDEEFRAVNGVFEGKIYPMDVDVNNIDKEPMESFKGDFTGVRLTAGWTD